MPSLVAPAALEWDAAQPSQAARPEERQPGNNDDEREVITRPATHPAAGREQGDLTEAAQELQDSQPPPSGIQGSMPLLQLSPMHSGGSPMNFEAIYQARMRRDGDPIGTTAVSKA